MQLPRARERAGAGILLDVQSAALVRVLAVAQQVAGALERDRDPGRELLVAVHPRGDRSVVRGDDAKGLGGERPASFGGQPALRLDLAGDLFVPSRVHDNTNACVVLGRCAHQCRAPDVDLLDHVAPVFTRGHGLSEQIQVADDEIDRLDAGLSQLLHVIGVLAVREDPGVDLRVQRLHAPIQHLWESRKAGDRCGGHSVLTKKPRRRVCRDDARAALGKAGAELAQTGSVGYGGEDVLDRHEIGHAQTLTGRREDVNPAAF